MITIRFSGRVPSPKEISIGQETDSNADKLRFRLPEIADGQVATLQMILPDGTPDVLLIEDGMITIPARLAEIAGRTRAWVEILGDETKAWHSELFYLNVGELPPISERTEQEYPTALQDAIYRSETAKEQAESAANAAEIAAAIAKSAQGQIMVEINGDGDLIVTYEDTEGQTHEANLGPVSAYSVAVKYGYDGTEEEWEQNVASVGEKAAEAAESAEEAEASKEAALAAKTAAQTAKDAAEVAKTEAETAAARDVTAWLDEKAGTAQAIAIIDKTLSISEAAADSQAAGQAIGEIKTAYLDTDFHTREYETLDLTLGGVNASTGALGTDTNRARTEYLYTNGEIPMVRLADNVYSYRVFCYGADDGYIGSPNSAFVSGPTPTIINMEGQKKFIIVLRNTADASGYDFTDHLDEAAEKIQMALSVAVKTDLRGYAEQPIDWQSGGILSTTGAENNSQTKARTGMLRCDRESKITAADGYTTNLFLYDADGAYIRSVTTPRRLFSKDAAYCRLMVGRTDGGMIADPNGELRDKISIKKSFAAEDNADAVQRLIDAKEALTAANRCAERPQLLAGIINVYGLVNGSTNRVYSPQRYRLDDYEIIRLDPDVQMSWRGYDALGNFIRTNFGWETAYRSLTRNVANSVYQAINAEMGTIGMNGVLSYGDNNRARTKHFLPYNGADAVTVTGSYKYSFRFYDTDFSLLGACTFISTSGTVADGLEAAGLESAAYYKMVFARTDDGEIGNVDTLFAGLTLTLAAAELDSVQFNVRYSNDAEITDADAMADKLLIQRRVTAGELYDMRLADQAAAYGEQHSTNTGNCTIRAAKEHHYADGSRDTVEWYLLEEPETKRFYMSRDLTSKTYMFEFDGIPDIYSFGITADGDVIAVRDAASLPWTVDPDRSGYYIGDDGNRENPIVLLARELWSVQHEVRLTGLKPCGWDKNVRFRIMADGTVMFAEYTRPTVETCNIWRISGDPLLASSWSYVSSMQLPLSGSNSAGIKHYHYVQQDPYTGVVYVGTGDDDVGSMAWYSTDWGQTFTQCSVGGITSSEQYFRLLNYVFTEDAIYWAGDTNIAGKHKVYRCRRNAEGVIDYSTIFELANLGRVNADHVTLNSLSTYGMIHVPECNALLLMERLDGSASGIDRVPIRVIDLEIADADIAFDSNYNSSNVAEAGWLEQIGDGVYRHLGFECRYMDYGPENGKVHVGYNLNSVSRLQDANPNRGFDNNGSGERGGINSMWIRLSWQRGRFVITRGVDYP